MKKLITLVIASASLLLLLTGCGEKSDKHPAYVEITDSEGNAYVYSSHIINGNTTYTGLQAAISIPVELEISDGSSASIKFYCDTCGYTEELEATAPYSHVFSCQCEDDAEAGIRREYIAVLIGKNAEFDDTAN